MTKTAGPLPVDLPLPKVLPLRPIRALRNACLALAACAAGCTWLGRAAPFPEVPGIFPKWKYFAENRDSFEVIFVGSSRFYHQIITPQFDAAVAKGGPPVRSFNFSYDGMWPPESCYLLRRILALHPARLRWVVFELMDINTQLDERNNTTLRTTYWHDLRHTAMAFRDILASDFHPGQKADFLLQHGRLCATQVLNLGRGADLLAARFFPPVKSSRKLGWETAAGYEPRGRPGMDATAREEFVAKVKRLPAVLPSEPLPPVYREALHDLIGEVRRAGAEPIFVIAPTPNPHENFTEVPDGAALIALNNPAEFPELFDPEKHQDAWHLNEKGAVDFTAILAEKFRAQVEARR